MRVKHMQHRNIQILPCNIPIKHLQHSSEMSETRETYSCNMQQNLAKRGGGGYGAGAGDGGEG
jgi:hypothetical protein